ncbi:MAG: ABC transporter transmembrane domain-containing protein [Alphaproteobacteria bacterium]
MANNTVLSELYCAALPSVRDKPLQTMPKSLYTYVSKVSAKQQVRLCLLTVLVFPITLVPLELQRRIVDGAVAGEDVSLLVLLGGLYFAVVAGHGILKFLRNIYLDRVAEGVTRILRTRIAHSDDFNADPDEGTAQSIISSEAEKVGGFVAESIAFPLLQAGIVMSVGGYMLAVEPIIAAVAIAFLVPSTIVVALSQPVLNRLSEKKITAARELGQCVLSNGRGEAGKDADPDSFIERIYRLRLRFALIKHATKGLNNLINHMGPLSVLMVGGWLVIQGQTEIGTIVAFMSGYERMTSPARDLLNFYRRLAMMRVQYRLVYDAG